MQQVQKGTGGLVQGYWILKAILMIDRLDAWIVFLGLILILMIGVYIGTLIPDNNPFNGTLGDVLTIAKDNAVEHKYKKNIFDCDNFSRALVNKLQDEGYRPKMIVGCLYNGVYIDKFEYCDLTKPMHAWVEVKTYVEATVWIESTTGEVVNIMYNP